MDTNPDTTYLNRINYGILDWLIDFVCAIYWFGDTMEEFINTTFSPIIVVIIQLSIYWIILNLVLATIHSYYFFDIREWLEIGKAANQLAIRRFVKSSGLYILEPHLDYKDKFTAASEPDGNFLRKYLALKKTEVSRLLEFFKMLFANFYRYVKGEMIYFILRNKIFPWGHGIKHPLVQILFPSYA